MLLLTGATGLVGSALLPRLLAEGTEVRCLVRDPRRLGAQRVRVQIALGDLTDPPSFRNALRGVQTVVHLAASIRDQPRGSIEELGGIATWRMVEAAERQGVERFVFFSASYTPATSQGARRAGRARRRRPLDRVRAVNRLCPR
jgi:NADH dehydrogenase